MYCSVIRCVGRRGWGGPSGHVQNIGLPQSGFVLEIKPGIGYFVLDNFAMGLRASLEKVGEKEQGSPSFVTSTDFNIGPFLRYYFLRSDKIVNIFSDISYQYGVLRLDNTSSKNSFIFSAGPVAYFNSLVGIEFLVSYSTHKYTNIKGRNNTIMLGLGLQVHL